MKIDTPGAALAAMFATRSGYEALVQANATTSGDHNQNS